MHGHQVVPLSQCNVLYIPAWSCTSLVSWRYIASKCRMVGEDDWTNISLKNGTHLFTARCTGPNLYELPAQVKCQIDAHGQAHAHASVQFWYEALGHSSPKTWAHATDRYPDGNLIPPRPHKFFCDTCAQSNARNVAPTRTNECSKHLLILFIQTSVVLSRYNS